MWDEGVSSVLGRSKHQQQTYTQLNKDSIEERNGHATIGNAVC